MNLLSLQTSFQTYVLTNEPAIHNRVVEPVRGNKNERIDVYGEAYYLRLLEAAILDYRCLYFQLGDAAFWDLFVDYINKYPSHYFTVHYIGFELPQYLRQHVADKPYLAELAEFEIALNNASDAKDVAIATMDDLRAIDPNEWGNLRFTFHPSLYLLEFNWNILEIWQGFLNQTKVEAAIINSPTLLTIWRKKLDPFYYVVDQKENWMIAELMKNVSFGDVCEGLGQLFEKEEEIAPYAVNTLIRWLNEEMVSEVKL